MVISWIIFGLAALLSLGSSALNIWRVHKGQSVSMWLQINILIGVLTLIILFLAHLPSPAN